MKKKSFKHFITLSLSIILTIATIIIINNDILAIQPQKQNNGCINVELKLYDINNEEIFINDGDIEIYNLKELEYDEEKENYIINEKTKEVEYLLYGNKIVLPSNVYLNETIDKTLNTKNTSYNIHINDIDSYFLALLSENNILSFNDYEENIVFTQNNNYNSLNQQNFNINLDDFLIVFNNTDLKNSILKFKFQQKEKSSTMIHSFNQITEISYSTESENTSSSLLNNENLENNISNISKDILNNKNPLKNYSNSDIFNQPIADYINKEINDKNQYLYKVNNGSIVNSIANEGIIEKIDSETLKIKYTNNFYVLYQNVISSVYDNTLVNANDIIGISKPNSDVIITYVYDNKAHLCDWLIDEYPEPLEGPSICLMKQNDMLWKNSQYGDSTIGRAGCGPSSFSMILSYYKNELWTPERLVFYMKEMGNGSFSWCHASGQGSYHSIFFKLAEEFDLKCEDISISEKSLKEALENEQFVVICIAKGPIYKGDGHFIVLRGVTDDGFFLINDPYECFKLNEKYTYRDLGIITTAKTIFK